MTDDQLAEGVRLAHEQINETTLIMIGAWNALPPHHNRRQQLYEAIKLSSAADLHFLCLSKDLREDAEQ